MHSIHLSHTLIVLGLVALIGSAKAQLITPRLTVVVVVDGLSERDLNRMRPYWSQGGMYMLANEGYHSSVTFPHEVYGGNETVATILTGALPNEHGYIRDSIFVRESRTVVPRLWDAEVPGIGSDQRLSTNALRCATIADRLRQQEGSRSKIYAVGIHSQTTMLLAGHTANACCWIDKRKQQWATSTFYPEGLPNAADEMNIESESRTVNQKVTELALRLRDQNKLGADEVPDMLLLEYSALSADAVSDRIKTAAHEELYAQLNTDLGKLFSTFIQQVGRNNLQILLVGKPHFVEQPTFNIDRAAALTSTYLMALYGHERWIDGGYGNSIYLNHDLISQKKLSLIDIQRQITAFLLNFEGIQAAYAYQDALLIPELRVALDKHCTGDIVVTLEKRWNDQIPVAPVFYWGPTKPKPTSLQAVKVTNLL